jgi:hypothetical protein
MRYECQALEEMDLSLTAIYPGQTALPNKLEPRAVGTLDRDETGVCEAESELARLAVPPTHL